MLKVVALLLIALQAADAWTTMKVIRAGGYEANPVLRWLADRLSPALPLVGRWTWLALAKLAAAAAIWWLALRGGDLATALLMCALVVYGVVIAHNVAVLRKLNARRGHARG